MYPLLYGGIKLKLIVGTRGSKLAIAQTEQIVNIVKDKFDDIDIEIKVISTRGDQILDRSLDKIGDKGIFTQEIERQLIDGEIDFAIHSLKDMPSQTGEGLTLVDTVGREDPRDLLILNSKYGVITDPIDWLKSHDGVRIGTGSKRRKAQLLRINPRLNIDLIRGNIDTRIKKMEDEPFDAIVLAAAGINRLNMKSINAYILDVDYMIPAVGQGALAIEIKKSNSELINIFEGIADYNTNICVRAERAYLAAINGGCHIPVGAIASIEEDVLTLRGIYGNEECDKIVISCIEGSVDKAEELGVSLAGIVAEKLSSMNCMTYKMYKTHKKNKGDGENEVKHG